jgi:hypothetical protein
VWHGPDIIGLLGKPQLAQHSYHQEPVAVLTFLRSPHANAGMKQYECGRTQPLLCMGQNHGKLAVDKILIKIIIRAIHNHYYNNQP